MTARSPWTTELIQGDPMQVGERELIPVVRMRSVIRRQASSSTAGSGGGGGALVWLQPVAVIERRPDGDEVRIPIADETAMAIKGMFIGALILPIVYLFVACLARLLRRRRSR